MKRALGLLVVAIAGAVSLAFFWPHGAGGSSDGSKKAIEKKAAAMQAYLPQLMRGAGDPATFIPAAQKYLREQPKDAGVWAALGSAYAEQARRTADPALFGKADGALEKSLKVKPEENVEALVGKGTLANARHEFGAARDWALKAKKVNAYNGGLYGVLSDAYLNMGDLPAATEVTQRMLDLQPGVTSFTRGANIFEQRGRIGDAERALRRALQDALSAPDAAFCHHRLGEIAWSDGRPRDALRSYDKALAMDSEQVASQIGRARAEAALGRRDAALRDYAAAVGRRPQPQSLLEYGEFLESLGRADEARAQYAAFEAQEKLMAESGGVEDGLTVGQFEADHGDPAVAADKLRAEWGRRPSPVVADAYGWALHRAGRSAEALPYAERAGKAGVRSALFAYHRGEIERALGRRAEAERDLAWALRVNPHFSALHGKQARADLAALRAGR